MTQLVQARWDVKLANWALWFVGGSGRSKDSALDFGSTRYRFDFTTRPPQPLIGEAVDTDRLLQIIAVETPERHLAIRAWYVWTGPQDNRAAILGISYSTWRDRVMAARYRLDDLDLLRRAATVAKRPRELAFG